MIDSHELRRRDSYLNKLIGFQDTEPVKVITGIRRCGKSSLLKLMVQHLKDTGVLPEQIIEMNFESFDFRGMSTDDIYRYVKERIVPGKRMYLFFDELQRIEAWEDAINAFRVDFDCDIYVTDPDSPLAEGVGAFTVHDEHYQISDLAGDAQVFLQWDSAPGGTQPAGWTRKIYGGRIVVLTPGPTLDVWENPEFRKLLVNAIEWTTCRT